MEVRLLTPWAGARFSHEAGKILDMPDAQAKEWIANKRAEPVPDRDLAEEHAKRALSEVTRMTKANAKLVETNEQLELQVADLKIQLVDEAKATQAQGEAHAKAAEQLAAANDRLADLAAKHETELAEAQKALADAQAEAAEQLTEAQKTIAELTEQLEQATAPEGESEGEGG